MAARVVLFLDHHNVYNAAREAFYQDSGPRWVGQVAPLKLGQLIAARGLCVRELAEVRVYRGRPDPAKDPKTYMAHMRQCQEQIRAGGGKVNVITRTLRYPPDWPNARAQEKGIDVALAIDFVRREAPSAKWRPGARLAAIARA